MTQICEAVYENGVLRPLDPPGLGLAEGQRVRIAVQAGEDVLDLAARVSEGLSDRDVDDVERIALDRSRFSGPRRA